MKKQNEICPNCGSKEREIHSIIDESKYEDTDKFPWCECLVCTFRYPKYKKDDVSYVQNPKTHTCPDCGYTWIHGHNGSHSCSTIMGKELKIVKDILAKVLQSCAGKIILNEIPEWREYAQKNKNI